MKIDEILLLVKAGYTRQEIDAMEQTPGADPVPPAQVAPAADQTPPAPAAAPVPPAAAPVPPAADPVPVTNDNSAILNAINALGAKMTAAMQAASLGAAMMQQPGGDTLESVMAQIIPPVAPTK